MVVGEIPAGLRRWIVDFLLGLAVAAVIINETAAATTTTVAGAATETRLHRLLLL
jgi:hypothetical protein